MGRARRRKDDGALSRGFICALAGVAITIFAWFSPWLWPAWPAFTVLEIAFSPERPFSALDPLGRGAVVILLIVINVAAWAAIVHGLSRVATLAAKIFAMTLSV